VTDIIDFAAKQMAQAIREDAQRGTCQETTGTIGESYLRCGKPSTTLVQHRGRTEGPYWMCDACAFHNVYNRDAEDVTPAELRMDRPVKVRVGDGQFAYVIQEHLLPEVYALLSRLEKQGRR
jgi:hypothetical protein